MGRDIEMSDKDMHRYYLVYDAFGDQAAARFLEKEEARKIGNSEKSGTKKNQGEPIKEVKDLK